MNLLVLVPSGCNVKLLSGYSEIFDKVIILGQEKYKKRFDFIFRQLGNKNIKNLTIFYSKNKIDYLFKALKILDNERIDFVISQDPYSGFYNVLLKKLRKTNGLFLMCQDFLEYLRVSNAGIFNILINKFLLKFACRNLNVLALSNYIKERAVHYGARKADVVPIYGIDTNVFYHKKDNFLRNEYKISGKILLTVARLNPEKGLNILLKSFKEIVDKDDIYLFIVGIGPLDKNLKKLSNELGLDKRVFFIGWVDNYDLNKYYNSCDIFVLPSIKEGLGFVLGEVMVCGKPVVASKTGGIVDIVKHEETGLLVKPGDITELKEGIIKLLENKKLYKKLSLNGKKFVLKNYISKVVFNKFKDYLLNYS